MRVAIAQTLAWQLEQEDQVPSNFSNVDVRVRDRGFGRRDAIVRATYTRWDKDVILIIDALEES